MTTYEELIDLKFRQRVPTFKLIKRYPERKRQIHEVALMGISESALKKTVKDKKVLKKVLSLKKKYPFPSQKEKPWFIWW